MTLTWQGNSSFKIQSKEALLFTNPEEKGLGRFKFDVLISSIFKDYRDLKEDIFLINSPGEYDVKDVFIRGLLVKNNKENLIIYTIDAGEIKICHLFNLVNSKLTEDQLDSIGSVDVLIIPVGGKSVLDPKSAMDVVNKIEPKLVIPTYYKIPGVSPNFESIDSFSKFFQKNKKREAGEKLAIKKKDLPEEGPELVILKPSD